MQQGLTRLILFLCFSFSLFGTESFLTLQERLPTPFCYLENLFLEVNTNSFIGCSPFLDPEKILGNDPKRSFSFKSIDSLPLNYKIVPGSTLFLFEPQNSPFLTHYFHLLEHIVGIWSFKEELADDVSLIVLACDGNSDIPNWHGPNQINFHLLKALFPNAEIKTQSSLSEENRNETLLFQRVITSDRLLSFFDPGCSKINKMLGSARFSIPKDSLSRFAKKIHHYAKTEILRPNYLRVTYLKRHFPRALHPLLENVLLKEISRLDHVNLIVADLAKISFFDQIHLIGNSDILVSVHGNGLSHILYLPSEAGVIEIFPSDSHALDYRLFSNLRGLDHLSVLSKHVILKNEEAYKLGAFGNINTLITEVPLEPILTFIRERAATLSKRS